MSDDVKSISHSEYGEIAYSTQEQVKIRKAIESHNWLLKLLIVVLIILTITILGALVLAYETQFIGQLLTWLAQLRLR